MKVSDMVSQVMQNDNEKVKTGYVRLCEAFEKDGIENYEMAALSCLAVLFEGRYLTPSEEKNTISKLKLIIYDKTPGAIQ